MKQYFNSGRWYLAIDHQQKVFRYSQNSAWRIYIKIKAADMKMMISDLRTFNYEEITKVI